MFLVFTLSQGMRIAVSDVEEIMGYVVRWTDSAHYNASHNVY